MAVAASNVNMAWFNGNVQSRENFASYDGDLDTLERNAIRTKANFDLLGQVLSLLT